MSIYINGISWEFPCYSLNKNDVFGNLYLLSAEVVLKGISLKDNESAEIQRRNFLKDKIYDYIADNLDPGCFIIMESEADKLYYLGESNGKYLVPPDTIRRVLREVVMNRHRPYRDEYLIEVAINEWMDRQHNEKIRLDQYVSKTMNQRVGSYLDGAKSSFSKVADDVDGFFSSIKNDINAAREKLADPFNVDKILD